MAFESPQDQESAASSGEEAGVALPASFEALFMGSMDAVLLEGADGRLLRANAAACALFGAGEDEIIARGRSAWLDAADERGGRLSAALAARGEARGEARVLGARGIVVEAEISAREFRGDDGAAYACLVIHDLTRQRASEHEATALQAQMAFALDAAEIGYWTFELPSGNGYRSPSMFRCFGYEGPVATWTHDDFERHVHPEDRARVEAAHEAARQGDGRYESEFRVVWPDASVHWLAARGRFEFDAAGNPVRMSGVEYDVTPRKMTDLDLAASRARFKSVIDLSPDGILIHHWGKIRYANRAAARLLGAAEAEVLVGLSLPEFITPELRATSQQRLDQLFERGGSLTPVESKMIRMDGTVIDVELTASTTWEGRERVVHSQIRDIADRKRHEREILALNQSLEARVEERTRELAAANRELESYSYMVAHDLRAPLRAISGFSGMLQEALSGSLTADQARFLEVICGNVERMNRLIDGLLQFSRSARGTLNLYQVDTRALIDAMVLELPGREGAQFDIGPLPQLHADPVLLRQIFANLLDNALKYSRGRESPCVRISAQARERDDVICIADNGVGFEPAYAHKLFGVFQRLHAQSEFEGTGVGLAIVRKVVERHGGEVWAEGAVGEGARFYFSLPRNAVA
ncbi:MAG TPA: PAS domain S-box protein [Burkholderiales bacterium]